MLKVGLTGGIGAGKSAVSSRLAALGAVIIDADRLAREVVAAGTDGQAEVVAAFGPSVLGADGELDRPALGKRAFGDAAARQQLEKIIHPRVRSAAAARAAGAPSDAIVVNDVPLLVETGQAPSYHLVLVVTADEGTRVRRLLESRGMSADEARSRIAAQATPEQRAEAADVLIPNDGDLSDLDALVGTLWRDRLVPFERNLRFSRAASAEERMQILSPDAPRPAHADQLLIVPPDAPWPAHADRLLIVPPDPSWPAQADRLIARIRHAVGAEAPVSHIGSTAVPDLPAKDVIDLMLAVPTLPAADAFADRLAGAGFPPREGEWADNARGMPGATWPKRLHGSADPGRPINLHVRVTGSPGWRFALLMRDHLRAVPAARDEYAAAKTNWRAQHPDVGTYAEAKEPWFDREATAAEAWAKSAGWKPPA